MKHRELLILPVYIASLFATGSAVSATAAQGASRQVIGTLLCLLAVGHLSSLWATLDARRERYTLYALPLVVGLIALPLGLWWKQCHTIAPEALADEHILATTQVLVWGMVTCSFYLGMSVWERRISFCIPLLLGLVIVELTASTTGNARLRDIFVVFAVFALFTIGYEHLLPFLQACAANGVRRLLVGYTVASGTIITIILCTAAGVAVVLPRCHFATPVVAAPLPLSTLEVQSYAHFLPSFELRGGTYSLGQQVILKVRSDHPHRWRGQVYTAYNGHGWRGVREQPLQFIGAEPGRGVALPTHAPHTSQPVVDRVQTVAPFIRRLYASGIPRRVRLMEKKHLLLVNTKLGTIFTESLEPGTMYQVESWVNDIAPSELRRASGSASRESASPDLDITHVPPEVRQLAREVTRHAETPYAQAEAIARYLAEHCTYSLNVPLIPPEQDAVAFFLFQSRQGACDLFASAFALMCRCVGIPARLVTGFIPSHEYEEEWFIIREQQAHAWVEINVPSYGWVPFDPTPATNSNALPHQNTPSAVRGRAFAQWTRYSTLSVLGLFLFIPALYRLCFSGAAVRARYQNATSVRRRVWRSYQRLCQRLQRGALPRSPSQTPAEYLDCVKRRYHIPVSVCTTLTDITDKVVEVLYSPRPVTAADAAALCAQMKRVSSQLRGLKKSSPTTGRGAQRAIR